MPFKKRAHKIMKKDVTVETFLSLAKTLSYSETANSLGITQQAVSKNILRLEERAGIPLFYRNSHKVMLTEWGEKCYQLYDAFFKEMDILRESYEVENNSVHLMTLHSEEFDIVRNLKNFAKEKGGQEIKLFIDIIDPYSANEELLNDKTDMIVTLAKFIEGLENVNVFSVNPAEVCLLISKDHPLYKPGVSIKDFEGEAFIAAANMDVFFGQNGHFIEKDIMGLNINPRTVEIVTNVQDAVKAADKGRGITIGASICARKDRNLVAIPTGNFTEIVCVWKKNNKKNLMAVAEHIKALYVKKYKGRAI